jgi:hypothetical protein
LPFSSFLELDLDPEPGAKQEPESEEEVEPLPWDWEPRQVLVPPIPVAQVPWDWDLDWVDPTVELEDEPNHEELKDFLVNFPNAFNVEDFLQLEAVEDFLHLEAGESAYSIVTTITGLEVADDEAADEEAADNEATVKEAADNEATLRRRPMGKFF